MKKKSMIDVAQRIEADQAYVLYAMTRDRNAGVPRRRPTGPFDYGDQATELLHMKRVGYSLGDESTDAFGMFMGKHAVEEDDERWVVVIKHATAVELTGGMTYNSLEAMMADWQLD